MRVRVDYFTDPVCAWSYASEDTVEKILSTYKDNIDFQFRSLPIIDRIEGEPKPGLKVYSPEQLASEWREIASKTGVQLDSNLWTENPPHSSWPANRAMKAALRQGSDKGKTFLHNLRSEIMQERKNPSNLEVLKDIAGNSGLNVDQFYNDMTTNATELEQEVVDDRLIAQERCITSTPTLLMQNDDGYTIIIQGQLDFDVVRPAIASLMGTKAAVGEPSPSI